MTKIYVWWNNTTKNIVIKYISSVVDIDIGSVNGFGHELITIIKPVPSSHSYYKILKNRVKKFFKKIIYANKIKNIYKKEYKENTKNHIQRFLDK